jgi:hypothetical protein
VINISKSIRQAYYDALQGNISVEVYKEDVPMSEQGHHVILRVEGEDEAGDSHRSGFVSDFTLVTEVVGVFTNSVDPDEAEDIDSEIRSILQPDRGSIILVAEDDVQIKCIKRESVHQFTEDDGAKRYYRIITRWRQRVSQGNSNS